MTAPALKVSLAGRDFLRSSDLAPAEAEAILDLAVELRLNPKQPRNHTKKRRLPGAIGPADDKGLPSADSKAEARKYLPAAAHARIGGCVPMRLKRGSVV